MNELLANAGISVPILNIGLGDEFPEHGTREECLKNAGLDEAGIKTQVEYFLQMLDPRPVMQPVSAQIKS
ncbi:1-deoxy-D-xylulose-5-phosphate synthase [compost metagenome]